MASLRRFEVGRRRPEFSRRGGEPCKPTGLRGWTRATTSDSFDAKSTPKRCFERRGSSPPCAHTPLRHPGYGFLGSRDAQRLRPRDTGMQTQRAARTVFVHNHRVVAMRAEPVAITFFGILEPEDSRAFRSFPSMSRRLSSRSRVTCKGVASPSGSRVSTSILVYSQRARRLRATSVPSGARNQSTSSATALGSARTVAKRRAQLVVAPILVPPRHDTASKQTGFCRRLRLSSPRAVLRDVGGRGLRSA